MARPVPGPVGTTSFPTSLRSCHRRHCHRPCHSALSTAQSRRHDGARCLLRDLGTPARSGRHGVPTSSGRRHQGSVPTTAALVVDIVEVVHRLSPEQAPDGGDGPASDRDHARSAKHPDEAGTRTFWAPGSLLYPLGIARPTIIARLSIPLQASNCVLVRIAASPFCRSVEHRRAWRSRTVRRVFRWSFG